MKVAAINNYVKYQNYAMPQFEGKKEKHTNPIKATLKAVPLAVLVAMSPLNTVQAQQQEGKAVLIMNYKNATPTEQLSTNKDCDIRFMSYDGNDEDAEKVELEFTRYDVVKSIKTVSGKEYPNAKQNIIYNIDADTLKVREYMTAVGTYKTYHVSGNLHVMESPFVLPNGERIGKLESYNTTGTFEITEDLYNFLKETMGEDVKYKTEEIPLSPDDSDDSDDIPFANPYGSPLG